MLTATGCGTVGILRRSDRAGRPPVRRDRRQLTRRQQATPTTTAERPPPHRHPEVSTAAAHHRRRRLSPQPQAAARPPQSSVLPTTTTTGHRCGTHNRARRAHHHRCGTHNHNHRHRQPPGLQPPPQSRRPQSAALQPPPQSAAPTGYHQPQPIHHNHRGAGLPPQRRPQPPRRHLPPQRRPQPPRRHLPPQRRPQRPQRRPDAAAPHDDPPSHGGSGARRSRGRSPSASREVGMIPRRASLLGLPRLRAGAAVASLTATPPSANGRSPRTCPTASSGAYPDRGRRRHLRRTAGPTRSRAGPTM